MAVNNKNNPQRPILEDPDLEADYLIQQLSALEALTTLGGPDTKVQFTADELHGMFHSLKCQAERIGAAIAAAS